MDYAVQQWMESGEYLPPFMRDFHDQKDLFKAVYELLERAREKDPTRLPAMTWVDGHIYAVDFFLWFMAQHGYTLQRSRKPLRFLDAQKSVSASRERRMDVMAQVFKQAVKA